MSEVSRSTQRRRLESGHAHCSERAAMPRHSRTLALAFVFVLVLGPSLVRAMPGAGAAEAPKPRGRAGALDVVLKDGRKLSLFDERTAQTVIAKVGDEVVTVRDLGEAIAAAHDDRAAGATGAAPDVEKSLARLIDLRLVLTEARAMGIHELPEFKDEVGMFTDATLRDLLKRRVAARAKPDATRLERTYRDSIREWKITSVLFEKEEDAKALAEKVKAGGSFDALGAQAAADKSAKAFQGGEFLPESKLLPPVARAISTLGQGKVSGVTPIGVGFALLRVDGIRYAESPQAREAAAATARNVAQTEAVAQYTARLVAQHGRIDERLLASLDYDRKDVPLEQLAKDQRVVARLDGKPAVTVAQLTEAIERKFFHGAKQAGEQKRANKEKKPLITGMLTSRALLEEARRQKLERSEELRYLVREKESALAFGKALERVILPEVKVTDADVQAFYDKHATEYTYPAMYRLEGLAFASAVGAEDAARKLRSGTDLAWLRTNAEGQLSPEKQDLQFGDVPLDPSSMPDGVRAALRGARAGECRTVVHEGQHYAIRIADVVAPRRMPLDEVRDGIRKRVLGEKAEAALASWIGKLRDHYRVEVLLASVR